MKLYELREIYNELTAIVVRVNKLKNKIDDYIEEKKVKDLKDNEQKRLEKFI